MKKRFRVYIVLLAAAISLGSYQYIKSCGGGWWDPDGDTHNLISQELIGETPCKPYLFTANYNFVNNEDPNYDMKINMDEWSQQLGFKVNVEDLTFFTSDFPMENSLSYYQTGKFAKHKLEHDYYSYDERDSAIFSNPIFTYIYQKKDRVALDYINAMSKIERSIENQNYWEYRQTDTVALDSIFAVISKNTLKKKLPDFYKKRYTFLLCKIGFHRNNFSQFESGYLALKKLAPKGIINTWIRGYQAAFMRRKGELEKASYEYSRIFVECPEIKHTAFTSFYLCKPYQHSYKSYILQTDENVQNNELQNDFEFAKVEKYFKNEQERANYFGLYMNRSYIPACTDMFERVIKADPSCEWVDVNLMRGIAQLEYFNTKTIYPGDTSLANELSKYKAFVCHYAKEQGLKRPGLWLVGAGYLSYLSGEFSQALQYYQAAASYNQSDSAFQQQIRILEPLAYLKMVGKITPNEEQRVLDYFLALKNMEEVAHLDDAKDEMMSILIAKYRSQNENQKSEALANIYMKSSNWLSEPRSFNIDSFIQYVEKPSNTPYDKLCKMFNPYSLETLHNIKGGILLGLYLWKEAKREFEKGNDSYKLGDYTDVFMTISELPSYLSERNPNSMTRIEFCNQMINLEKKVKSHSVQVADLIQYANALYNISFWGNNTSITEYGWPSVFEIYRYGSGGYANMEASYNFPMFNCDLAESYYIKAAQATKDRELQAQCYFWAAICEQNKYYRSSDYSDYNKEGKKINYRTNFKVLKSLYRNTKYYQERLETCSYLKTFDQLQ